MNKVRPIGTEFWSDWNRDSQSSGSEESRILYKVVEIVKIHKNAPYVDLIDAERVEPIKKETRPVIFVSLKDVKSLLLEVETFEELQKLIDKADSLDEMNNLREATVKFMNEGHPEILKLWQDKYWNLKKCPTCGRLR